MMSFQRYFLFAISLVVTLATSHAEILGELDGASGKVFKINPEEKTFELLKETEYAPKTDIGQSRFTVHWTDETRIVTVEELKEFPKVDQSVVTMFYGINDADAKKLEKGGAFVARVAEMYPGVKKPEDIEPLEDRVSAVGWFSPDKEKGKRSGLVQIDNVNHPVSLRDKHWKIYQRTPLTIQDLQKGFWQATLSGEQQEGKFVVKEMEVSPLPDPRETDDPKLPRVLVIGDSISMNYHDAAKEALKGIANYHRNEGNSFSSGHGVRNAELWLGNYHEKGFHWDVIQFNHGLHDLKQVYDKEKDEWGEYAVTLEDYKANLEKEIAILKKTGAKLIWCSTTPVPNDNKGQYGRAKGASTIFNDAAMEVMKKHPEIIINDLHQVISDSPVFDNWRKQNDVHFYKEEERKVIGDAVAEAVKKALK